MRGGIFPAELAESEARDRVAAEPSMDGADFAQRVTPDQAGRGRRQWSPRGGDRHRHQAQHPAATPRAELPVDFAPVLSLRRRGPGKGPRPGLPRQRPGRSRRSRLRGRERAWDRGQEAGGGHLPRPPAALPGGGPRDLQAPLRPPRRQPPGQGSRDRPDRHHLAEPRLRGLGPGGDRTIDGDEPVRWQTDFGEAELSHLNLYDRTVEGLVLKDVPGCTVQYHPEAGPGPHDARYLFDRFLELAQ